MEIKSLGQNPRIILTRLAYNKMKTYVKHSSNEIGWLGSVKREDNIFTITDVYLLEQEVNGSTCELSPDAIANLYIERDEQGLPNDIKFWGHSHVNMSVCPSSQDDTQFMEFYENNDFFIRLIMNKRDEFNVALLDKSTELLYTGIVPEIENDFDGEDEIIEEIKNKVHQKTYQYIPYQNGQTFYNIKKNENQEEKNTNTKYYNYGYDEFFDDEFFDDDYIDEEIEESLKKKQKNIK